MDTPFARSFLGLRWKRKAGTARGPSSDAALKALLASLPALGLFLAGLLPQEEVYPDTGYGLSLLAALGAVGYAGLLANYIFRHREILSAACSMLSGLLSMALVFGSIAPGKRGGGPAPVVSMLLSFFILFSGLGGWVGSRTLFRESRLTAHNLTV